MHVLEKKGFSLTDSASGKGPRNNRRMSLLALLRHPEILQAIICGVLLLAGWGMNQVSHILSILLYVAAYGVGGWRQAKEGMLTLIKERDLDVNLLMIAAAIGAASIGYWNEGAMLIFIFALSGALETFASDQSRKSISSLIAMRPETAVRLQDGKVERVPVSELEVGDLVLVRPGETVPADGLVQSGASAVNQAAITGESIPVDKSPGDGVYAGTLNGENPLYVEVKSRAEGTLFAKIISLVEEAQETVPASQRFMEKFEGLYAKSIVGATLLLMLLLPLGLGWTWPHTAYKTMVFLVVASPCALVASIMPAILSAISNSARKGLLFKGGVHLQNLADAQIIAFDKTGTLTLGEPVVTDLLAADGEEAHVLLQMAASAEQLSAHPLAKAVVAEADRRGHALRPAENMRSIAGWGVEAEVDGEIWAIGKPGSLYAGMGSAERVPAEMERGSVESGGGLYQQSAAEAADWWQAPLQRLEEEGKTVSLILRGGLPVGLIALRDEIRPAAKAAIQSLRELGIRTAMLTGDHGATARAIAKEAGVDIVLSDLLPQDKAQKIQELRGQYGGVVMVGDGINDAPALAAASVGVAMGAGSGAALEAADVVLMNNEIGRITGAVVLARRCKRIVKQNLVFALSIILLLIMGNFGLDLPLPLGVVGHEGSTILVILNGLRLLRDRSSQKKITF